MHWSTLFLLPLGAQLASAKCKCTPTDECWPSTDIWNSLNTTVHGRLIHNRPLAEPCYPGRNYDRQACQFITKGWTNSTVLGPEPIGYSYPLFQTCPPVNNGSVSEQTACSLGNAPVYTINATEPEDIAAGISFAKENNVRLVIKNTGHDLVGRSQGYGSLMIWIRNFRKGVDYHERFTSSSGCPSNWTGSAFTVGGGYVWGELYDEAAKRDHVVVGGNDPTVGVIGGYIQGAGHGPASHQFGLGTDQVLEMTVVLATGEIVTANACQNADLFTALRGGGGGTYGVVISTTIKAYPTHPVLQHRLTVVPLNASAEILLNVSAQIVSKYPAISDEGFSGLTHVASPKLLGLSVSAPAFYTHNFGKFLPNDNTSATADVQRAKAAINEGLIRDLLPYNGSAFSISSTWTLHSTFKDYYASEGGMSNVGTSDLIMASRLFDKPSLQDNQQKVDKMINTVFSNPDGSSSLDTTLLYLCLIGGGKVLEPQPYTSVNPGWRKAYLLTELMQVWGEDTSTDEVKKIREDVTGRKTDAMRALTPRMGTYLNEADRYDPDWKEDFWGENYGWLRSVKERYDPEHVFWCYPCVGSEGWVEEVGEKGYGALCQRD